MSTHNGEPRVWALRDRSKASPQRALAREMRAAPTEAERKLWWHLRHRMPLDGTHFRARFKLAATSSISSAAGRNSSLKSMVPFTRVTQRLMIMNERSFSNRRVIVF